MVLPMVTNVGSISSLPPDVQALLAFSKYFVFGLWIFGLLFALFSPVSALSTMCLAIFGTYLLSEDPQMVNCYAVIRSTVIGQCCGHGGLQMLMPFLLLSAINTLMDSLQLVQVFTVYGVGAFKFIPVDLLLGIWVCEFASTAICWRVLKTIMPNPADGYQQLPGGPVQTGSSATQPAAGFQPFCGQGHRLGG
eukprot:TRINITY_DN110057_c0_g1_i1.p1 TRINITY_DN110057_c0_g1~~TRINITY_DN110057_c0_g1_i1.p1  ORF type:complete len:193 (-),score=16.60 TRINITY_DN110057_c0_g1_i1:241-819(-)